MRRLGLILVCLGMAFLVSCSKDETDSLLEVPPTDQSEKYIMPYGTFEGEWQLSKYGKTCSGTIEVDSDKIIFDLPVDYLLPRLGLVDETSKAAHPDEPFFTTTSDYTYYYTTQVMHFSMLGFSTDAMYIKNDIIDNVAVPYGYNSPLFSVKADDTDYTLNLIGLKEQPSGIFDNNTGLWKLSIPIDKVTIYNQKTHAQMSILVLDEEAPDKSAWLFVFRAKRKIK